MECEECQRERQSRNRKLTGYASTKLQTPEFGFIPAAVPNNDVRYEINRLRAQLYAQQYG